MVTPAPQPTGTCCSDRGVRNLWLASAFSSCWRWQWLLVGPSPTAPISTCRACPRTAPVTSSIPTSAVIVAASDLQIGAELRQEDLRAIQWPSNAVPAGAFGKPEDLIGRGLIMPVMTNEPFLPSKLASKEAGAGLPPVIPEGHARAVGARQRGHRRRGLRAARHARGRRRHGEPDAAADGHHLEGRS